MRKVLGLIAVELTLAILLTHFLTHHAGTVFAPRNERTQRMGVTQPVTVSLAPWEEDTVLIPVACLDMEMDQPSQGTSFELATHLTRFASSRTFQATTWRIRQFVIWTVFSHPESINDYVGLGLGQEITGLVPKEVLAMLMLEPGVIYELPEGKISLFIKALGEAGIPVEDVDELYRLFLTRGPTRGELEVVYQILREAVI